MCFDAKLSGGWGPTSVVEELNLEVATGETWPSSAQRRGQKTTLLELLIGRAHRRGGRSC